jgi:hypothetical protein
MVNASFARKGIKREQFVKVLDSSINLKKIPVLIGGKE